jgi:hypothetical protein
MASPVPTDRYLDPHQARTRQPTPYEDLLGDAIERAFASGVSELPAMVAHLNATGPSCENGQPWSEQSFQELMARLGA